MSGQFVKSLNNAMICESFFQRFRVNIMGSLMMTSRKHMIFGLMKLIKKPSSLSILCIIICDEMKRLCQEDLEVLEKLNRQTQFLVLSLESPGSQLRSKLLMKK